MSNCSKAEFWANTYQRVARILFYLHIFETKFSEHILDYLDSKVDKYCNANCKEDCNKTSKEKR